MYYPAYLQMPVDVYRKALEVAYSYPKLLARRLEFAPDGTAAEVNEWQIQAIEKAWTAVAEDGTTRAFVRKNLFERVQMRDIPLALSESQMRRIRKRFLEQLAQNLGLWTGL